MTLTLTLPVGEYVHTGKQVTFEAPCQSEGLTGLIVDGVTYNLVDADGATPVANSFESGALVSVIFHVGKQKAFIQNANTNAYLENKFSEVVEDMQTELEGKADSSHGTHVTFTTTEPVVAGTAAVGSATTVSRSDHIHPAQTSVSGNAGSATKLATARTISLTGDVTGSVSFDGSANASIAATVTDGSHNHAASNVTSGTFGVARGGTGKSSFTANRLIYPSASTTIAQLAFPTVAGSVLRQGTSGAPYWTSLADLFKALGITDMRNFKVQRIDTSCTWTAPKSTDQKFYVLGIGGGGGGGSATYAEDQDEEQEAWGCGGGGGGGYIAYGEVTIAEGASVTVTCGAGGAGGVAGGSSKFGSYLTAAGGNAGGASSTDATTFTDSRGGHGGAGGAGGGGGGYAQCRYTSSGNLLSRGNGGNGGAGSTYGGGGGGGAEYYGTEGTPGAGGTYSGAGGEPTPSNMAAISLIQFTLFGNRIGAAAGVAGSDGATGGGGGFSGDGGNATLGGGGGGSILGVGGNGGNGGGGGAGLFCNGGAGATGGSQRTSSGGGGGGLYPGSDGAIGGNATTKGGAGGNGGFYVAYFEEV